ncbi:hypothetical protein OPT61_g6684 [Boeremia exigua]|uniref:Uncharacterized protein n=1 Tax=Boeremia exigua TaxID=749465 RepID=A0ACC2I584_9PLEO|nr:hypothetical protein OPT61_g6684 [Boeremia exigua]
MNVDGASNSKSMLERDHERTSTRQPEPKPTKLRRFLSIGSRVRESRLSSKHHTTTASSSTPPLQTLSPHAEESQTRAKKPLKRSISSFFLHRPSTAAPDLAEGGDCARTSQSQEHVAGRPSMSLHPAATKAGADSLWGKEHPPLTGSPYQFVQKPRKDSAVKSFYDMPTAASRTAALTSHPVGEQDLGSEDEGQTPEGSGASEVTKEKK